MVTWQAALRFPLRVGGGLAVIAGSAVVMLGILLVGIGRGEGYSKAAFRVGQSLR